MKSNASYPSPTLLALQHYLAGFDPSRTGRTLIMANIWSASMDQQAIDTAVKRAREVMDGFMAAFNAEDADAMRSRWFNFPHVRFHSSRVTIMEQPEDFRSTVWERAGEAKGWARTAWDYVDLVDAGPDKVHFRVQFT